MHLIMISNYVIETNAASFRRHTSIMVIDESGRRRGPIEASSTVNVSLDAKSSFESVST